ncbi:UDP-glycosyltransferase 73C6 isoform X1 [Jatropha curcas]|uniref:UDP-glycosyltransferase 73C6 isoform X1 n=1 Tax=Jatropha curcas TaxID=180498 RepID=UPI001893F3E1|nr:UDP-glycosyltransferase 73C6 isoform X1 [Jatropha curcas]
MISQSNQLHFVLFPLLAQGHMIPMVDIAKLLAQEGAMVSIITTPQNAARHSTILTRAIKSGLKIQIFKLQIPFQNYGLPEGCENFDMLPSLDMGEKMFMAANGLQKPAEELFEELNPKPSCIISDLFLPWTIHIASKWKVPRISFNGFCCFTMLCTHNIYNSNILENITSENEFFVVPGLPQTIEITESQLPESAVKNWTEELLNQILQAEKESCGFIINTFEELEEEFVKEYKNARGNTRIWCIGPVSLCNKDSMDKIDRGNRTLVDGNECLNWLDAWSPKSVIYACLGSLPNLTTLQVIELGLGLESSKRPFIWVVRGGDYRSKEIEKWVSETGFEERIKGRGLFISGWAPQMLILSHPAIGGFVTHCGWNSTLEAISSGVPMATWPLFADQFINEKLVIQVLKIGVSFGVEVPEKFGEEGKFGLLVKKEDVVRALDKLMEEGEEREERNKRIKELAEMAKKATEEGGSSFLNIKLLIQDIMQKINHEKST